MTLYPIIRINKLKQNNLGGSGSHTSRQRDTPNADLSQKNIRIIGDSDSHKNLNQLVLDTISQHPQKRKIRSDAVYCVELLLTASPQYFRPDNPTNGGYYQQDRLEAWTDASKQWLQKKYGNITIGNLQSERIVRAELHLDEMTPHIHAYFVPLDENGQLRCRHFFNGREKMQKFQDSYYEAVKHLGFDRGLKGSMAKHEDIKDFYRIVEEGKGLEIDSLNKQQIKSKVVDRDRAVKQKKEMEATAKRLLQENQNLQQQLQNLQLQNQKLHQELKQKDKNKDLPLDAVAWHLGLVEENQKWQGHGKMININDSGFRDLTSNKKGNNPIELVMHVNQYKLDSALVWLKERFGEKAMISCVAASSNQLSEIIGQNLLFSPPKPAPSNWHAVRDFLIKQQGLDQKIVTALHAKRWVLADRQGNAVFIMRPLTNKDSNSTNTEKVTGAIVYNRQTKQSPSFEYAQGTRREQGLFYFNFGGQPEHKIQTVVICKTPVDALSLASSQMQAEKQKPKIRTMYLAVDSIRSLPLDFLRNIPKVIAAYENNKAELELAYNIKKMLPQTDIVKPVARQKSQPQKQLDLGI